MSVELITVPDIGGSDNVDVIEVCVAVGDTIAVDDSLIVLESDKASMEVPSPKAGKITALKIKEGDKLSEGDPLLELEVDAAGAPAASASNAVDKPQQGDTAESEAAKPAATVSTEVIDVDVPDIGGSENVDVIEISVAVGDEIEEGDSIIVLESDKASMEIPSPASGKVESISVKEGDKLSEGDKILKLARSAAQGNKTAAAPSDNTDSDSSAAQATGSVAGKELKVDVPDIGGSENVDVIEISVAVGDQVNEGDSIIVLESDKASMEIPAPASGEVTAITVSEGDKVSQGSAILMLKTASGSTGVSGASNAAASKPASPAAPQASASTQSPAQSASGNPLRSNEMHPQEISSDDVYAGPAVRKLARQLGVTLSRVKSSGPRGRLTKDDVKAYAKQLVQSAEQGGGSTAQGSGIPAIPAQDFSKFGEVELVKMSKIKKLTAANMSRNWLNVPHVTQFDDADITELEAFRKGMKAEAEKAGVRLTPVPFLIKACAAALKAEPSFNTSMHADGEHIVHKKYINIGMAVDTPLGLMVPVIKDADKKGLFDIAREVIELAGKARDGKLKPSDMQGGCFTISSLGPIGGTGFTPIVNAPEVGILGVSKASMKPVWNGKEFEPRQMLPLCLSYDHRAINGGDAGRFMQYLTQTIADIRRLLL